MAHLEVRDVTGAIYENTEQSGSPVKIKIGEPDCMYKFLHSGLLGKAVGEVVGVGVDGEEVFGYYDDKKVFWVPKHIFDPATTKFEELQPGTISEFSSKNTGVFHAVVVENTQDLIKLDTNHPYSKKKIICNVRVIENNKQDGEKDGKTKIREDESR